MNNKQILENAPEGATHYDGTYYRYEGYEHGQAYLVLKDGSWQRGTPAYPYKYVRSLDDIRRIVEFESKIEDFEAIIRDSKGVAGYHLNGDVALWEEFGL